MNPHKKADSGQEPQPHAVKQQSHGTPVSPQMTVPSPPSPRPGLPQLHFWAVSTCMPSPFQETFPNSTEPSFYLDIRAL